MANNRVYYAIQQIGFAKCGALGNAFTAVKGAQSVGVDTALNTEKVMQLGEAYVYDNINQISDVTINMERIFDGTAPLICLATNGATASNIINRSNIPCTIALSIFSEAQDNSSGTPISQMISSGNFATNWTLTCPMEGKVTESLSLISNDKNWTAGIGPIPFSGVFLGTESPPSRAAGSGGVQFRQNIIFTNLGGEPAPTVDANGQLHAFLTILPPDIEGISSSGTNDKTANGAYGAHIRSISVSASINRESLFELGRREPYFRYANFPIDITTEVEVAASNGDFVNILAQGSQTGIWAGGDNRDRTISVRLQEGLYVDCGTKNRLTAVSETGGDTGGGISTIKYTFMNGSFLKLTHSADPSALPWPY